MQPTWHPDIFRHTTLPPFALLEQMFRLSCFGSFPGVDQLNGLSASQSQSAIEFVCQYTLAPDAPYYELFIEQTSCVPTRKDSWHDLFNALVWRLFPRSKLLLNKLHVAEIRQHGLHPRTRLRNHLTHLDECGVLLITRSTHALDMLRNHQWEAVFFDKRAMWGEDIVPVVFGHANLEMLLNPFIGLTGKWLALPADDSVLSLSPDRLFDWADQRLVQAITEEGGLSFEKPLYPLPLLGIPGWSPDNTQREFYLNTQYFMPKRFRA